VSIIYPTSAQPSGSNHPSTSNPSVHSGSVNSRPISFLITVKFYNFSYNGLIENNGSIYLSDVDKTTLIISIANAFLIAESSVHILNAYQFTSRRLTIFERSTNGIADIFGLKVKPLDVSHVVINIAVTIQISVFMSNYPAYGNSVIRLYNDLYSNFTSSVADGSNDGFSGQLNFNGLQLGSSFAHSAVGDTSTSDFEIGECNCGSGQVLTRTTTTTTTSTVTVVESYLASDEL